jgi:hypothetical protein
MTFKELEEELEFFSRLPLWGKILVKIYADMCYTGGAIFALLIILIEINR